MATRKRTAARGESGERLPRSRDYQGREVTFVSMQLTRERRDEFLAEQEHWTATAVEFLSGMIAAGYKVSASYDANNDCTIVSLTCWEESDPNYGLCLTNRAGDFLTAAGIAAYKTAVLCQDGQWRRDDVDRSFG